MKNAYIANDSNCIFRKKGGGRMKQRNTKLFQIFEKLEISLEIE
jgi:hypothetical protein